MVSEKRQLIPVPALEDDFFALNGENPPPSKPERVSPLKDGDIAGLMDLFDQTGHIRRGEVLAEKRPSLPRHNRGGAISAEHSVALWALGVRGLRPVCFVPKPSQQQDHRNGLQQNAHAHELV